MLTTEVVTGLFTEAVTGHVQLAGLLIAYDDEQRCFITEIVQSDSTRTYHFEYMPSNPALAWVHQTTIYTGKE